MSIQDTYFDVRASLENKPELELFDELMNYYFKLESDLDKQIDENYNLKKTICLMKLYLR